MSFCCCSKDTVSCALLFKHPAIVRSASTPQTDPLNADHSGDRNDKLPLWAGFSVFTNETTQWSINSVCVWPLLHLRYQMNGDHRQLQISLSVWSDNGGDTVGKSSLWRGQHGPGRCKIRPLKWQRRLLRLLDYWSQRKLNPTTRKPWVGCLSGAAARP